ncbi:glycosyltransferase family 2 protein, partial [Campylobacter jejuni]|nr:glycosyltransferase family 2 protein [Campylobacter jejuni]
MIKISILIPSFNSILYIKECLESVINQSLKEIEILCIDA